MYNLYTIWICVSYNHRSRHYNWTKYVLIILSMVGWINYIYSCKEREGNMFVFQHYLPHWGRSTFFFCPVDLCRWNINSHFAIRTIIICTVYQVLRSNISSCYEFSHNGRKCFFRKEITAEVTWKMSLLGGWGQFRRTITVEKVNLFSLFLFALLVLRY